MPSSSFQGSVSITHITTGYCHSRYRWNRFLTDPVFGPAGSQYIYDGWTKAPNLKGYGFEGRPPAGYVENLDPLGRQLLDSRHVFTIDDEKNLKPRPGVIGLQPWQTVESKIGGKTPRITGTPCKHFPSREVTGFVAECDTSGTNETGLANAVYISGDPVSRCGGQGIWTMENGRQMSITERTTFESQYFLKR
ncbi:hypothetical protein BBP40_011327 [Aspergillus hancockii]|nr:hypothetical protein BBP40_011327 [Aspergillus hancockii]